MALFNSIEPVSIEEAINSPTVSLVMIRKRLEDGENRVRKFVAYSIMEILKFFNIGKMPSTEQISMAVNHIIMDFYYLTMSDIKMVISMAQRGMLGEIYGHIDGQTIYSWFSKYNDMRIEIGMNMTQDEHERITASEKQTREVYSASQHIKRTTSI